MASNAGWKKDNFLIDLTGGTPGAAVILNGRAPVTPWLIGAYPSSDHFVYEALSYAPKQVLRSSWLLITPKGRRQINLSVLSKLGLDYPEGYIQIGSITTGYRNELQLLWKPK